MKYPMFYVAIFEIDPNKQMVNLTKMAKAFNKRIGDWMRLEATKEFFEALSEDSDMHKCISLVKGNYSEGDAQGTWGNQEVAIEFAQWISPKFKVFCIRHLKRLFNEGSTSVSNPITESLMTEEQMIQSLQRIVRMKRQMSALPLMTEEQMIQSLQRIVRMKRQMSALQAELADETVNLEMIQHGYYSALDCGVQGSAGRTGAMTGSERARRYRQRKRMRQSIEKII